MEHRRQCIDIEEQQLENMDKLANVNKALLWVGIIMHYTTACYWLFSVSSWSNFLKSDWAWWYSLQAVLRRPLLFPDFPWSRSELFPDFPWPRSKLFPDFPWPRSEWFPDFPWPLTTFGVIPGISLTTFGIIPGVLLTMFRIISRTFPDHVPNYSRTFPDCVPDFPWPCSELFPDFPWTCSELFPDRDFTLVRDSSQKYKNWPYITITFWYLFHGSWKTAFMPLAACMILQQCRLQLVRLSWPFGLSLLRLFESF